MKGNVAQLQLTPLYGLLYNFYAATDIRGIAPSGWHIPSSSELTTLQSTIGSNYTERYLAIREIGLTHWNCNPTGITNIYGFTALGSGSRNYETFAGSKDYCEIISTSLDDEPLLGYVYLWIGYERNIFFQLPSYAGPNNGMSIRCLMDNPNIWYEGMIISDYDNNTYHTVQIGTQVWLVENLAVTHYNNGDIIPEVTDQSSWASLSTGALCAYNNDWSEVFK